MFTKVAVPGPGSFHHSKTSRRQWHQWVQVHQRMMIRKRGWWLVGWFYTQLVLPNISWNGIRHGKYQAHYWLDEDLTWLDWFSIFFNEDLLNDAFMCWMDLQIATMSHHHPPAALWCWSLWCPMSPDPMDSANHFGPKGHHGAMELVPHPACCSLTSW